MSNKKTNASVGLEIPTIWDVIDRAEFKWLFDDKKQIKEPKKKKRKKRK